MIPSVDAAVAMLDRFQMPWCRTARGAVEDDVPPIWNGYVLNIHGMNGADIIHDLAHWLTCAPQRRRHVNYGLGADYAGGGPIRATISTQLADLEEVATCLLDISILEIGGWNWQARADFYSLDCHDATSASEVVLTEPAAFRLAVRRKTLTPAAQITPELRRHVVGHTLA